jgi:hypothetical protein
MGDFAGNHFLELLEGNVVNVNTWLVFGHFRQYIYISIYIYSLLYIRYYSLFTICLPEELSHSVSPVLLVILLVLLICISLVSHYLVFEFYWRCQTGTCPGFNTTPELLV